jgi:hypothetical protein
MLSALSFLVFGPSFFSYFFCIATTKPFAEIKSTLHAAQFCSRLRGWEPSENHQVKTKNNPIKMFIFLR